MSHAECRCFEQKLAYFTAPSLLGIKCANLVSMDSKEFNIAEQTKRFNKKAECKGLRIKLMCRCKNHMLVLLYNKKLLKKSLCDANRRNILMSYGYEREFSLEKDLNRLSKRIAEESEFPHEIGIFLGYPTEDVEGFIANKGDNFKLCGCWKVYGDEEKAKRLFINYDRCRSFLCNKLNEGSDIYRALKIS